MYIYIYTHISIYICVPVCLRQWKCQPSCISCIILVRLPDSWVFTRGVIRMIPPAILRIVTWLVPQHSMCAGSRKLRKKRTTRQHFWPGLNGLRWMATSQPLETLSFPRPPGVSSRDSSPGSLQIPARRRGLK